MILEIGKPSFALINYWQGNAVKVRKKARLRTNEWLQVGVTYDGSRRASGVQIYLNGKPAEKEIVRDHLYKDFANSMPLTLAARFRGRGFKGGLIDDLQIFNRQLTPLEVAAVYDPETKQSANMEYYLSCADVRTQQLTADLKKLRDDENQFINGIPEIMIMG